MSTDVAGALRAVPVLAGLRADQAEALAGAGALVRRAAGEVVARQGDPADAFWVILEGEVAWSRSVGGHDVHAVTLGPGDCFAELILLTGEAYPTTGRALGPVLLFRLPPGAFWQLLGQAPPVLRAVTRVAVERAQVHETVSQQQARLVSLGSMAAGLAHELNNPASAARRAAEQLADAETARRDAAHGLSAAALAVVAAGRPDGAPPDGSPLQRADREDALLGTLEDLGLDADADAAASDLAEAGWDAPALTAALGELAAAERGAVARALAAAAAVPGLLATLTSCTQRISTIVGSVRAYTYLDRDDTAGPVDVAANLEDVLAVLTHRLAAAGTVVSRDYRSTASALAAGGRLNQALTSLLENAVDAAGSGGRVVLRTADEPGRVLVEVEDDGPGIEPGVAGRVFDPFFTTKPVGQGVGLGLYTARQAVAADGGELRFTSEPGRTVFQVRLPRAG